jgi:hypothetical protein
MVMYLLFSLSTVRVAKRQKVPWKVELGNYDSFNFKILEHVWVQSLSSVFFANVLNTLMLGYTVGLRNHLRPADIPPSRVDR